ncbi:hypothetical protein L596_026478 [Steinernema carpocapsae]|uniref:Uncharacterized protein n=1 Tax=Steinernema carpocapsae TaxID=34508 RepID=A0A4U5M1J8_STECR|nr:hypothetical protein L596_026478 [Steinernema carpocapsae]
MSNPYGNQNQQYPPNTYPNGIPNYNNPYGNNNPNNNPYNPYNNPNVPNYYVTQPPYYPNTQPNFWNPNPNPWTNQNPDPYGTSTALYWLNESPERNWRMDKEVIYYIIKSLLLGGGVVFSLLILLLSICCRRGHFRGIRWYAVNLMVVNLIHIANMVISDNTYGIHDLLLQQFQQAIGNYQNNNYLNNNNYPNMPNPSMPNVLYPAYNAYKYFITNYDLYTIPIKRWTMCVYCFTTTFLALETVHRYRTNSKGLPAIVWLLIVAFADLAPAAIFITYIQGYPTLKTYPNVYESYHFVVLCMLTLAIILFFLLSSCICCCSTAGGTTARPFGGPALAGVLIYIVCTAVTQYTYAYIVTMDLGYELFEHYDKKLPWAYGYIEPNLFAPMKVTHLNIFRSKTSISSASNKTSATRTADRVLLHQQLRSSSLHAWLPYVLQIA